MRRLRTISRGDYQESVTTGQTHRHADRQTDAGQNDPYAPSCFAGDSKLFQIQKINMLSWTIKTETSAKIDSTRGIWKVMHIHPYNFTQ